MDTHITRAAYLRESSEKTLRIGRLTAFIGIPALTLFAAYDVMEFGLVQGPYWRLACIIPLLLFLVFSYTLFRNRPNLIIPFNTLTLLGLNVMMAGLIYLIFNQEDAPVNYKYSVTLGYAAVLFISLIIAGGGRPYLPYIIFLPLIIISAIFYFEERIIETDWAFLSNIYIIAVVVMIFARNQERNAFEDFEMRQIIKEREKEVQTQKEKLEFANQELQAYNYSVSHDLRNPLRSILLYATLLKEKFDQEFNDEDLTHLIQIKESAMQMNQLIDDMLAFSQVGNKELYKQALDMKEMFQDVFEQLVRNEPKRNIRFIMGDLKMAYGDPVLVRQVVTNLLSNAIKYTQKADRAEIEVQGYTHGDQYVYQIRDNGVGFDDTKAEEMFRAFRRLHEGEPFEGSGVGLAIVKKIIQRHRGRVWASGSQDQGASFFFTLPLVKSHSLQASLQGVS